MNTVYNGINVEAKSMVNYLGTIFDQDMASSSMGKYAIKKPKCQITGMFSIITNTSQKQIANSYND